MRAASALLLGAVASVCAAQLPFQQERPVVKLAPESSPAFISSDAFTTLSHEDFDQSIRIKRTDGWCDSVKSYAGYIDTASGSLFFWFFEARKNPHQAPLTLWTNGGPGASSSMGMLMELGPCTAAQDGNSTVLNKYGWNEASNMIFIEQPVDVGFSQKKRGVTVGTSEDAAKDIHAFLSIFLEHFPEFKGRDFHLSGESYGGAYLPSFAVEILYQNALLAQKNTSRTPINLRSVLIGNGLTDEVEMLPSYYTQTCTSGNGIGRPILDIKTCTKMQPELERCHKMAVKACRETMSEPECDIAIGYCNQVLAMPFNEANINPYDISKSCTPEELADGFCYAESLAVRKLLNQPWIREKFGISKSFGDYVGMSWKVNSAFAKTNDILRPRQYYVNALLERGVRVLIYVGEYDWICNYHGNYALVQELAWTGQADFVAQQLGTWSLPDSKDKVAGKVQGHGPLQFVTIAGGGHMVPMDKPAESLHMFERWIKQEKL